MSKHLRKAAQYVRMSTDMQQYSTLNQQALIAQYAADHGIEIIKTYVDEGRSGLRLAGRDALQSLLADVTSGQAEYEVILVYDVSRWGRFQDTDESAHYEFICRRAGKSIIYCAEQFTNDGSPMASIVKGLKRVMAGEYSRELSSKVFLGQSRLAALGHHVGAPSPYGLRRVMFDTTGQARTQLEYGQRKYLHSDKVFLRPGPQEEIDVVKMVFQWFLEEKIYYETIAKRLKAMGVPPPTPHPAWNKPIIRGMLKNEKYLGHIIYNRYTERLRSPKKKNPKSQWVRHNNAFEGIIDETTFRLVQEKIAKNIRIHSNEALLAHLKEIYKKHGRISTSLIIGAKGAPAPSSYRRAFGTMERAYIEIGYNVTQHGKDHHSKKIITQKESCAITNRLLAELKFLGCNAKLVGKVNICINRKWVVMIAAISQTKAHPGYRMFLRGNIDAILAYKPNATDPEPNYYLIPCSVIPGSTLYINNPKRREWFKQWRVQWENLPTSLIELARALKPTDDD